MYEDVLLSLRACAFMRRWKLAVHPYSPVTMTQGVMTRRLETTTFSHSLPMISLIFLPTDSNFV
jgi:hypothetical protein